MTRAELLALAERLADAPGVLGMLSRSDLASAAAILRKIAKAQPVAHMLPSDLMRFESSETFAQAFSVAVGNPSEQSQPLYSLQGIIDE